MGKYRPWGKLAWLLPKIKMANWNLVGCLGTEDRSLETYRMLRNNLLTVKLVKIFDEDYEYSDQTKIIIKKREDEVNRLSANKASDIVEEHKLLESHNEIISSFEQFIEGKQDIILDVSSLPKRFFFPMLKILINSQDINNLIITYTVPKSYTPGKLSENLMPCTQLPLFSGGKYDTGKQAEALVIAVGFDPMGIMPELGQDGRGISIKLLFPFPAPLSSVMRSWEFVRGIERGRSPKGIELFRVEAKNPSDAFDRLCTISAYGKKKIELAPFGPKPVSIAVCLFASLTESEVFYAQPKKYAPDYSSGVSEVFAYAIKLGRVNLYSF